MTPVNATAYTMRGLPWASADVMVAAARESSLRHSWPGRTGRQSWGTGTFRIYRQTFRAACGAQVRIATLDDFDPHHERACPRCVAATRGTA